MTFTPVSSCEYIQLAKLYAMDITNINKTENDLFEGLINGLINQQYGCSDDFISQETVSGLRNNIENFRNAESLKIAGLGKEGNFQKNIQIRGDQIKWIEKSTSDDHESLFLKKIGNFVSHLNMTCFTAINDFESHYACYEPKSFYKRHLDQFKNDNSRKFSIVFYLNEDWTKKDGGMLSLYPKDSDQINISPQGGRMVFFKSDEMEHEVHPSFTRNRISIAGWLKS